MTTYCLIETVDGTMIAEQLTAESAEETALRIGGTVVDPGPYDSAEDAYDALLAFEEEAASESDSPDTQVMEERIHRPRP